MRSNRRPDVNPIEVTEFLKQVQEALDDESDRIVLNADESCWRVLIPPKRTITNKGKESVALNIKGDKKAGFTIMGTISSDGEKFPLFMIAEGATERCRKQLGNHPNFSYKVIHTESGWMSSGGFLEYLGWIREVVQNEKIYLLVDQYPTHFTEDAKVAAQKMNIILIPIPKGGTDRYQPLDRRIFGIMKSMGAARWSEIYYQNPGIKLDKS